MEIFKPKSNTLEPTVPVSGGASSAKARLSGLDCYHGDEPSDWKLVHASFDFIFMKATDGNGGVDPAFVKNWAAAKAAGIPRGPYHFMQWGVGTGADQANHFCDIIEHAGGLGELPPVCDWEHSTGGPSLADKLVALPFLQTLQQRTGRRPIIYLSSSTPSEVGTPPWLANYPLWIASYRSSPRVPAPWKDWTFWQYTDSGALPGFKNKGDLNYFNGDMRALLAL